MRNHHPRMTALRFFFILRATCALSEPLPAPPFCFSFFLSFFLFFFFRPPPPL
jgi:hypothetical protein